MSTNGGMTDAQVLDAISKAAKFKMPRVCRDMYKPPSNRSYADLFDAVAMPLTHAHAAVGALIAERDALRQEAQIHAQEARTANATIAEIYQICTGGTGEPGNWNGAEPVRKLAADRDSFRQEAESLRQQAERSASEVVRLAAEVLRLQAALRPLADVPIIDDIYGDYVVLECHFTGGSYTITAGQVRAAVAALPPSNQIARDQCGWGGGRVKVTIEIDEDEVLVALKRGEDYEDVHPELVSQDAQICWPDWRTIDWQKERTK